MVAASVLRFPSRQVDNDQDFRSKIMQAGSAALSKTVDVLMEKYNGKDLQEVSEMLLHEGESITGAILSEFLNGRAKTFKDIAACPGCGRECKTHSLASRTIETRHGKQTVERPYFHCDPCGIGFVPFDQTMKLAPQKQQYDLQAGAAQLLARLPFEEAEEVFRRITGKSISNHAMHDIGARLGEASRIGDVLPTKKQVEAVIDENTRGKVWRPVLVVAGDGAHAPTRPETGKRKGKRGVGSWQEAKGFRIYLIGQDRIEQVMSWHQIANEDEFGEALNFAASLIPQERVRIALIGDGAKWLWPHMSAAFPEGKEILDHYHCSEHVHKLAELQYPKDEERQAVWIESTMARLFFGDVESVIWGLQRMQPPSEDANKAIDSLIGYLRNNAHRIDYKKNRRGQFPLGSGGIESANKFICHKRMKVSGAWWYKINGNRMLRLRCAMYNSTFDEVFARYKRLQVRGAIKPPRTSRNA